MRRQGLVGASSIGVALVLSAAPGWPAAAEAPVTRYVDGTDPTCGGRSPCHDSIRAAVSAAQPGDTVQVGPGTYVEQVVVAGKNSAPGATEASRIVIEADPAAPPGAVTLRGAVTRCTRGHAILVQQSRYVTIRGFTITGAGGAAIALLGDHNGNHAVHVERNRIVANGSPSCNGGITIARGNPGTLIVNNLIHGNGRSGIATLDTDGGPHDIVGNTIHGNGWHGVSVNRQHRVLLANNAITHNGTGASHHGVRREGASHPDPAGIQLLHNLVCGNRAGEIGGPVLDPSDAGNLTPTGSEGPGVSASPACASLAAVYAEAQGPDGLDGTADDGLAPARGSPLVDQGLDPRTLPFPASRRALLEADFLDAAARPRPAIPGGADRFDIGAIELAVSGGAPPIVGFVQPQASAFLRGPVTVAAEARDADGIVALSLQAAGRPLAAEPVPPPPAPSVAVAATWDTATVADGAHTLTADAVDGAGQRASAQRGVIVDNTPPDTAITAEPASAAAATASFAFTGSDNLSAPETLVFAWRVDGQPFGAFTRATSATVTGLDAGPHTFEVKARDQAGNEDPTPAVRPFSVASLLVAITDPAAGATVPPGVVLVRGTVTGAAGEVGVLVNGVMAAVEPPAFLALVPVSATTGTLTAVATTPTGEGASHTVAIAVSAETPPDPAVALTASPRQGAAPLAVTLTVRTLVAVSAVALDLEGDGVVDVTGPSLEGSPFTYSRPGLYTPTVTVTDAQGTARTARTVVRVLDPAALDAQLRARWAALKDALRAGDVPAALVFITARSRPRYEALFLALGPRLSAIDAVLTDLTLDELGATEAFYTMSRADDGIPLVFEVRFAVDDDGLWRIHSF